VLVPRQGSGAIDKRLASRGISIEWNEFTSSPPLLEALGAAPSISARPGDVPPLFAQAAGGDLLYVAATKGRDRRLGDPGQERLADRDAGRPQGQERCL